MSVLQAAPPGPAILAEITAGLAAGRDLRELLDSFLEPIVRLSNARAGAVRMLCPDGEQFELVSAIGLPESVTHAEHLVAKRCGFCGQSGNELRVTWTNQLGSCAARTGDAFFANRCRGAVAVPLQHKGRMLGVYNLFFEHGEEPAPAVVALLRTIGELLGLALENRRLEAENLQATVSRERQMMAAEVHDAVAQNLTFIKMRLPLLRDAIESGNADSALNYLEDVRETLGEAHGSLREIVTHFRTRMDPHGLARALDTLAAQFRARSGVQLDVENGLGQPRLPDAAQAELYHIVQEALANVEHHANARHAWLALESGLGRVNIRIEDDGVGTAPGAQARPSHYGLEIMRERAARLGGELRVGPRAGGGTCVQCSFPMPQEEVS